MYRFFLSVLRDTFYLSFPSHSKYDTGASTGPKTLEDVSPSHLAALRRHCADTAAITFDDKTAAKVPCANNPSSPPLLELDQLLSYKILVIALGSFPKTNNDIIRVCADVPLVDV